MQDGDIIALARMAASLARTERPARVAAARRLAMRVYRGVQQRKCRYYSVIRTIRTQRLLWLGSYETPEEAAYAWDAASRVTRGYKARPNFPEPDWARAARAPWAPEEVSTELTLALPRPAAAPARRRQPAAAVAAQASFHNWLLPASAAAAEPQRQHGAPEPLFPQQQQRTAALPPFTQFFHLSGPATAAAAANGVAPVVEPSNPGACVLAPQNVQMPPTNPASTVLSSTVAIVLTSQFLFLPHAAPTHHRVDGASTSAAPPPMPRLTPKDLLLQIGLPGHGGPGGAE